MKISISILSAMAVFATSVFAADATRSSQKAEGLLSAFALKGKQVENMQGERLGDIQRLLIDHNSGRVRYAVVEVDKAWNWNDPEIAVPFGALQINRQNENDVHVKLDATKEKLQNAPKFKQGDADRIFRAETAQPIYSFWSVTWFDDDQPANLGSDKEGSQPSAGSSPSPARPMSSPGSTPAP